MKYVGLSLSFCVKAILAKEIPLEYVEYIVPGFRFDGKIPEHYYDIYWSKWTKSEVDELLSKIKLVELPTSEVPNIAHGIWWFAKDFDWSVIEDHKKRLPTDIVQERIGLFL